MLSSKCYVSLVILRYLQGDFNFMARNLHWTSPLSNTGCNGSNSLSNVSNSDFPPATRINRRLDEGRTPGRLPIRLDTGPTGTVHRYVRGTPLAGGRAKPLMYRARAIFASARRRWGSAEDMAPDHRDPPPHLGSRHDQRRRSAMPSPKNNLNTPKCYDSDGYEWFDDSSAPHFP